MHCCMAGLEGGEMKPIHDYAKYLEYIKNVGGNPTIIWFDNDWSPIGRTVREEMEAQGIIRVSEFRIYAAKEKN